MALTILTDDEVRSLLHSLTREEVQGFQRNLREALHDYSTGTQETTGACSANQPMRTVLEGKDGTTLFMPARTSSTIGVKVVTIAAGKKDDAASEKRQGLSSETPPKGANTAPRGSLTLLDETGAPKGFINAEEFTAFRTALASTLIFSRRNRVHDVVVFGAGKQAYWHIRLALILRGADIHHVNIISRSFEGAEPLLQAIYKSPEWEHLRSANPKLQFSILSQEYGEYTRLLKERVRSADVMFLCTPATSPLFPAEYLIASEGRKKARYISCIGSYKPHMVELHPDILKHVTTPEQKHSFFGGNGSNQSDDRGGVIVVDSLEACMKEAGEIIQAAVHPENMVEIGELIMVRRSVEKEMAAGGKGEEGMAAWFKGGNIIYKSVGLGIMDLSVGENVIRVARERGLGTTIHNF